MGHHVGVIPFPGVKKMLSGCVAVAGRRMYINVIVTPFLKKEKVSHKAVKKFGEVAQSLKYKVLNSDLQRPCESRMWWCSSVIPVLGSRE